MAKKPNELKELKEWKRKHIKSHQKLNGWQRKIEADLNRMSKSIFGVLQEVYRVENQSEFIKLFVKRLAPVAKETQDLIGTT